MSVLVVLVGRDALLLRYLLDRPEIAPAIIVNRDGKGTEFPDPPLCGIQLAFAFKRLAAPSTKLGFPLFPRQCWFADHWSVAGRYILFRAGCECRWHDPLVLKSFPNTGEGAHINATIKAMRKDRLKRFGYVRENGVNVRMRKHHAWDIIAPRT